MCSNHTAVPVHAGSTPLPSPARQVSSVAAVVPRSVQYVGLLNSSVIVCFFCFCLFILLQLHLFSCLFEGILHRWRSRPNVPPLLFHAAPQHLIGRNKHDADDESDGKSTYQALAHARLLDLLRRAGACRVFQGEGRREERLAGAPSNPVLFTA